MNRWIKAAVIFAIGALIAWGIHTERTGELADWVSTADAVITNIEEYHSTTRRAHSSRSYRIYYTYVVDGVSYSGDTLYSGRNQNYTAGQAAVIWYDPDDHTLSSFHKPYAAQYSLVPLTIAFFLALRTLFWGGYRKAQPQKRRVQIVRGEGE